MGWMAGPLRVERAGAWRHVTARGNERRAIDRDEVDRAHFCQLLGETVEVFGGRLHAYVLMDNYYHLLAETPEPNLGRGRQCLNVSYSVWFNRRPQRAGIFSKAALNPSGQEGLGPQTAGAWRRGRRLGRDGRQHGGPPT